MTFYSKLTADYLVTEFKYLVTNKTPYYPYGKNGKQFIITNIEAVEQTDYSVERMIRRAKNKIMTLADEAMLKEGNEKPSGEYEVEVTITVNEDIQKFDIKTILKGLGIKTDIDKIQVKG